MDLEYIINILALLTCGFQSYYSKCFMNLGSVQISYHSILNLCRPLPYLTPFSSYGTTPPHSHAWEFTSQANLCHILGSIQISYHSILDLRRPLPPISHHSHTLVQPPPAPILARVNSRRDGICVTF